MSEPTRELLDRAREGCPTCKGVGQHGARFPDGKPHWMNCRECKRVARLLTEETEACDLVTTVRILERVCDAEVVLVTAESHVWDFIDDDAQLAILSTVFGCEVTNATVVFDLATAIRNRRES